MSTKDNAFNEQNCENDDFTEFSDYDALYNNQDESADVYGKNMKSVKQHLVRKSRIAENDKKTKLREK